MPYPFDKPKLKHDLLTPPLPNGSSLSDAFGFRSSAELFEALASEVRSDLKPLSSVYSYPDAPTIPLSQKLLVIGVADVSLSVVRKLVDDEDDVPDCLQKCTVAVKRADGSYGHQLPSKDVANSTALAQFLRRLRNEGLVAILAQDKHHRFGILKPTEDTTLSGDLEGQDFAALCFVGITEKVKAFLSQGLEPARSSSAAAVPVAAAETSGLWQPPASDDNGDSAGLWQPPTADDENGDAGFSWNPPTEAAEDAWNSNASSLWQAAGDDTNDNQTTNHKRPRDDDDGGGGGDGFHQNSAAAAADAFYSKLTRTLDTRADSRIYHMRAFNGWVKATQIAELDPKTKQSGKALGKGPLRVLDLACGKGGDLGKWVRHERKIGNYVGIDVARGSLKDAAIRAREMRNKLTLCTFTCADLGADVPGRLKSGKHKHLQTLLTWSLQSEPPGVKSEPDFRWMKGGGVELDDKFDVVSIQFAIHYMMSTRARARRFFRTVSELLEIGGNLIATTIDARVVLGHMMNLGVDLHFDNEDDLSKHPGAVVSVGGGACQLRFEPEILKRIFHGSKGKNPKDDENLFGLEYTFTLVEGSDHAAGVGDAVNLPEWLTPIPVLKSLGEEVGLELEYAQNFHEFYDIRKDPNVYHAAHESLYGMRVLNRHGSLSKEEWEISRMYCAVKFRKVREAPNSFEDDEGDADKDNDEEEEIDPKVKAKLLPMAMLQAKKKVGAEEWKSLSSDEKARLIDVEVRKLAKK